MQKFNQLFAIILCASLTVPTSGLECWTEVKTTDPEGFGLSLRKMRCPEGGGIRMQCAETKCVTRNGYATVGRACADRLYCETTKNACEFDENGRMAKCDLCDGDLCNGTGQMRWKGHFVWAICLATFLQQRKIFFPLL